MAPYAVARFEAEAIAMIGPTAVKVHPKITGSLLPKYFVPMTCNIVAIPHVNKSAAIR